MRQKGGADDVAICVRSDMDGRGFAILNTTDVAEWLKKVFNSYREYHNKLSYGSKEDYSFDALELIPFEEKEYILPMYIDCEDKANPKAVMPEDENMKKAYDLRGNYGRIIQSHVKRLAPGASFKSFSITVRNVPTEEAVEGPVAALLAIENNLRMILGAALTKEEITDYPNIANPIRSLSEDVSNYPLYIWAVARSFEPPPTTTADEEDYDPILIPKEEIERMTSE